MIEDLRVCSEKELREQIVYLEHTPVRGIADLLIEKQCSLNKGVVRSLKYLGNLKTEFGEIGTLIPNTTEDEKKFRVSEVMPILRANPKIDYDLLDAIETLIQQDRAGNIVYNVTVFGVGNEYIVKDGDKRTIAFYENRKSSESDVIKYPVYVVTWTQISI